MKRSTAAVAAAAALALPASAQAHVTVHPNDLPAGAFTTMFVDVPNEEDKANTTKVDVQFPPGFLDVSTQQVPGWKATVLKRKLATPVKTPDGTVTEEVSEVIWSGGKIPPGSFQAFPISTQVPENAASPLTFKAIQTYDDGTVVRWIGPPSADQPAPTVAVAPKGGAIVDVAGGEAGPAAAATKFNQEQANAAKPAASSSKGASKGLGIAALVIAILALVLAIVAAVRPRAAGRERTASP